MSTQAKADWLKSGDDIIAPFTLTSCVFDKDGKSVDEVIEQVKENVYTSQGRNKMPFPYKMGMNYVDSGITFDVDNDGTIHVSGTVSNYTTFDFVKKRGDYELLPGTYTVSGGISNDIYLRVQNVTTSTDVTIATDTGNGATFTLTEKSKIYIYLQIRNNVTVDTIIYPMLELGQVTHGFEPPAESNMALKKELDTVLTDAWTQRTYEAGEYAIDGNKLWKCLVTNSERPKEGANWHQVTVMSEVNSGLSAITTLNSNISHKTLTATAKSGVTIRSFYGVIENHIAHAWMRLTSTSPEGSDLVTFSVRAKSGAEFFCGSGKFNTDNITMRVTGSDLQVYINGSPATGDLWLYVCYPTD